MIFKGWRGEIEIVNSSVVIRKKPNMDNHVIPFSQIVSTIIEKPGLMSNGCIFIQTIGSKGTSEVISKLDYALDKNSIFFTKKMYKDAIAFKEYLDKKLSNPTVDNKNDENFEQLRQLKSLLDDGIISQEDFDTKKKELLGI